MKRASARPLRGLLAAAIFAGVTGTVAAGCQTPEPELPPPPCQPGACPPGQWPSVPPSPDPSPTTTTPGLMPAFVGFPCATTEDMICGWGRCIAGRCGGCQTSADCKTGGACGWTPIGMACVYGGAAAPR